MKIRRRPRTPQASRRLRRARQYALLTSATLLVLITLLYVAARVYWPTVAAHQVDLEQLLTRTTKHTVRLGRIEPYWDGFNPGVRVWGATVYGEDGRTPSVRIAEVEAHLALLPLLWGRVEVGRLVLSRPALTLVRHDDGRIAVAGLATPVKETSGGGLAWLLQQPRIIVQNGEVRWLDARDPAGPLLLSQVEVTLRNSAARHRLTVSAVLPLPMCRECSASLDISGDPMQGPWSGEIGVRAQGLNVVRLPLAVRERLPPDVRGQFNLQLSSEWRDGQPQMVRGEAAVKGLRVPLGGDRRPLSIRDASATIGWRVREAGWRLDVADLKLLLSRRPWSAGRLRLAKNDDEISFDVQRLELDDVTAFVANHQSEHPWLKRWVDMHPVGTLEHVDVRLRGPYNAPEAFAVKARLLNIGVTAYERAPGVRGVSGQLSFNADGGEFALDATDFALDLPTVFREPLGMRHASGQVRWEKRDNGWHIAGDDLRVRSDDGNGTGSLALELSRDPAVSPVLKLRIDFRDGNGAHAARYYPVHHLPPRTLDWMESAFMGGRVVSGHVIYEGPTRAWPFEAGQGRFEIRGTVRDGVYRYLRGWTPVTEVEASVAVDGSNVRVTGRGRIGTLFARNVRVDVRRTRVGADERVALVQAQIDGPLPETLRVLREVDSPRAGAWQAYLGAVGHAGGTGTLDVDLQVPIKRGVEPQPSFVVAYRFKDAAVKLENGTGLEAANGFVRFSESGLREGNLHGQLFGGPLALVALQEQGELRLQGNGRILLPVLLHGRPALAERVGGGVDWSLAWQDRANGPQLRAEADLRAVRSRLPPPLGKTEAGPFEKLTVSTEQSRANGFVLALAGGPALNGKLAFAREEGRWRFRNGRLEIGKGPARPPSANGLEIACNIDALDVDRWLPLLASGGAQTTAPLPFPLALSADIKQLNLANRRWGRLLLHLVQRGDEWRTVIDGDAVAGEGMLVVVPKALPRIRLDLAFLRLPERVDAKVQDMDATDPRRLPTLDLHALSLEYKQRKFGELNFSAVPYAQGWRVDRMDLKRAEMSLKARGAWRVSGERQFTDLHAEFDSDNMGTTLDAFGAGGQMADGKVRLRTDLSWLGSPLRPALAGLDGKIEVSAERGRFLKVDPGAARLFGLLDLRSIGRYLTLDFSPAFGKGFVFDAIHGNVALEKGNAYTSNLIVKGPSLALGINGRVGLASEDYDLVLEASPQFGSTLTLTSLGIFGPQAAAAVLALQRLFRRQIEAGTRITYLVKGPWDTPKVTKLAKSTAPETATPPVQ